MSIDRGMDEEDVVHIHNGILLSHKKERNNAICSNMDGLRDDHTKWTKSDRERQISYDITYMWNLKKNNTNELIYKTETDSQTSKQTYGYQRENVGGRDKLAVWDSHIHTTIYKIDSQLGPTL